MVAGESLLGVFAGVLLQFTPPEGLTFGVVQMVGEEVLLYFPSRPRCVSSFESSLSRILKVGFWSSDSEDVSSMAGGGGSGRFWMFDFFSKVGVA